MPLATVPAAAGGSFATAGEDAAERIVCENPRRLLSIATRELP